MNSPEAQNAFSEREVSLVDGPTIRVVEVTYLDEEAERQLHETPASEVEAPLTPFVADIPAPAVDLIDYAPMELLDIQAEPLYVWSGDTPQTAAPDLPASPERRPPHSLQQAAVEWELAA